MVKNLTAILFLLISGVMGAQKPPQYTSGDIYDKIQKLGVLGTVVYMAAHPDDENTTLISYLVNERKFDVVYQSLTRGDGGQNLIGPELSELLGVIRTQELLAARRIDGGKQWFSRANDFGYSKHSDETFNIWGKEEILHDVVWAWRKWKPDVVINRFDHRSPGRTHGHHTASAILSMEAFDLVNNPAVFPKQLDKASLWQPERIFFNTSWWFFGSREAFEKADKTGYYNVDVGIYYPIKGKSNTEISAASRSMHKCQGFGVVGSRGSYEEWMEHIKGSTPSGEDFMSGINTTWTRVTGGKPIKTLVEQLDQNFDFADPSASIPQLLKIRKAIKGLSESYWKTRKLNEVNHLIQLCLGLYTEVYTAAESAAPNTEIDLRMEATNRSPLSIEFDKITVLPSNRDSTFNITLASNQAKTWQMNYNLPPDLKITNSYWLNHPGEIGMYKVDDQALIGLPETPRELKVVFHFKVNGHQLDIEKEVVHKRRDPVIGELYKPFEIIEPTYVNLEEEVIIISDGNMRPVNVILRAGAAGQEGELKLKVPEHWKVFPEKIKFRTNRKGEQLRFTFDLTPPTQASEGILTVETNTGEGWTKTRSWLQIEYDHIPTQTITQPTRSKLVNLDLKRVGQWIGYIMGAGDEVPQHLQQIGYSVTLLNESQWNAQSLREFDAVMIGIRAYNTLDRLNYHMQELFKYVEEGGTLIVQYNTSRSIKVETLAPYPLELGRERVTVENAPVQILIPDHEVMTFPNQITEKDFDGWVQERGLYFPASWDEKFTPILRMADPGYDPSDGSLLVAKYGKGYFVYTGISFFRELPAGVPGAYRLMANLIALGNEVKP